MTLKTWRSSCPRALLAKKGEQAFANFESRYVHELKQKYKSKGNTVVVKEAERPTAGNVINLMEAPKRNAEGTHRPGGSVPRREEAGLRRYAGMARE